MKHLLRLLLPALFFICFAAPKAEATHIVGGDITVKSLGSNNFEVTLTLFFDCFNGNPAAFDPFITIGVFDQVTHAKADSMFIAFTDSVNIALGDSCFVPNNVCIRQQRYIDTINLPNNPNGYYLTWHRCCRNGIISNIVNPGGSGNVFYVEIPDPALQNSSPTFNSYPDAYMCVNTANIDTFAATDIDGDSLVYMFSDPYDCAASNICGSAIPSPIPPTAPGPYSTVPWLAPYVSANFMGDPAQNINQSGIIFTQPPTQGVFVFCVQIDEYRNGVKIGEVRRDMQYYVLSCNVISAAVVGPNPICLGQTTTLSASGGNTYQWNTGQNTSAISISPTAVGSYTYIVTATLASCIDTATAIIQVVPTPTVVASPGVILCSGQTAQLNATGATSYAWSPAAGLSNTNISNPVANPGLTTTYVVTGTLNGCTDTARTTVTLGSTPVAAQTNIQELTCEGISAEFFDASAPVDSTTTWFWNLGDGSTFTGQNPPPHVFPFSGTYNVTLIVTTPPCSDTNVVTISIGDLSSLLTIKAPNVFTPNGDGLNDCFKPIFSGVSSATDSLILCTKMQIFDRWGIEVFESEGSMNVCWDGKTKSNTKAKDGTYYYLITFGETILKGHLTLLREKK